jgi:hypothetical protein
MFDEVMQYCSDQIYIVNCKIKPFQANYFQKK